MRQILSTAPGATSWMQVTNILPKTTMVYGGTNANKSKQIFVCRAWVQGDLITGAYHNDENSCYIAKCIFSTIQGINIINGIANVVK